VIGMCGLIGQPVAGISTDRRFGFFAARQEGGY